MEGLRGRGDRINTPCFEPAFNRQAKGNVRVRWQISASWKRNFWKWGVSKGFRSDIRQAQHAQYVPYGLCDRTPGQLAALDLKSDVCCHSCDQAFCNRCAVRFKPTAPHAD